MGAEVPIGQSGAKSPRIQEGSSLEESLVGEPNSLSWDEVRNSEKEAQR